MRPSVTTSPLGDSSRSSSHSSSTSRPAMQRPVAVGQHGVLVGRLAQRAEGLELGGRELPSPQPVQREPVELAHARDARGLLGQGPQALRRLGEPLGIEVAGGVAQPLLDLLGATRAHRIAQLLAQLRFVAGPPTVVARSLALGRCGRRPLDGVLGFVTDLLDEHPLLEIPRRVGRGGRAARLHGAAPRLRCLASVAALPWCVPAEVAHPSPVWRLRRGPRLPRRRHAPRHDAPRRPNSWEPRRARSKIGHRSADDRRAARCPCAVDPTSSRPDVLGCPACPLLGPNPTDPRRPPPERFGAPRTARPGAPAAITSTPALAAPARRAGRTARWCHRRDCTGPSPARRRRMAGSASIRKRKRGPEGAPLREKSGGVLLSQGVSPQVPSALVGLTSVFGMGTGVTPPLWPPKSVVKGERAYRARTLENSIASTNILCVNPSPRPISTGRLNTLPCLHLRPINVVVWPRALPG